jgi:hypothetical protein
MGKILKHGLFLEMQKHIIDKEAMLLRFKHSRETSFYQRVMAVISVMKWPVGAI